MSCRISYSRSHNSLAFRCVALSLLCHFKIGNGTSNCDTDIAGKKKFKKKSCRLCWKWNNFLFRFNHFPPTKQLLYVKPSIWITLLLRFLEEFHTAQTGFYPFYSCFLSLHYFFLLGLGNIFVLLLFETERAYSSVQIALLLPVITAQCPATQINGLLSREHERGGPSVDKRQTCFFHPTTETNTGHHSSPLQNICQPLVSTTTYSYNTAEHSSVSNLQSHPIGP